jgi:superkiller protein 3
MKTSDKSVDSIDRNPENLTAINTLVGMGILTDDDGLIDAALSEILALPVNERYERDSSRDITYLLIQHHLGQVRSLKYTMRS